MNNLMHMADPMELELPATPEFVSTARLFAAEASRHLGATEETVADLKIAISEACTSAIGAGEDGTEQELVRLTIEPLEDAATVKVFSPLGFDRPNGLSEQSDGLGMGLVQALFPGAEFLRGQGPESTLRIVIPLES